MKKKGLTFIGILTLATIVSCTTTKVPFFPEWMDTGNIKANAPDQRWTINPEGGISWDTSTEKSLPHFDHFEMSGFKSSALISYGVNSDGTLSIQRHLIWPTLRKIPNNTHAHLSHNLSDAVKPNITVGQTLITQYFPQEIKLRGNIEIDCLTNSAAEIKRTSWITPSEPGLLETWEISNPTDADLHISVTSPEYRFTTQASQGVSGAYDIEAFTLEEEKFTLAAGKSKTIFFYMTAAKKGSINRTINPEKQVTLRKETLSQLWDSLVLETPDPVLNRSFQFAKLRASESIFETKNGLMHSPGGASYYAALWTNDQCEYVNPFFPFTGYQTGIEESINCYRLYKPFMDDDYNDLVSSIIAEGTDTWNGAGDRGDAAMYSYGAARFALANGDRTIAQELWPMIQWGLEYSRRQINENGVVSSDSDELEGRFPTGDANLCTSSLYYDALISSAAIARELKLTKISAEYENQAKKLRSAMEIFFGAEMEEYQTYRYFDGNHKLRSWICIPLTVGIFDRAKETIDALYSPHLWFGNGMLTEAGSKTFWDRSTLYAFRGTLYAGETEITMKYLSEYSQKRLLGEHVPYPVEAWPEGNQKHLSAESGLYCRIFTEGLFGIRPTGFNKFTLIPRLPANWNRMELKNIKAFNSDFDILVQRVDKMLKVTVTISETGKIREHIVAPGEVIEVKL